MATKTSYKASAYSFTRYPTNLLAVPLNTTVTCSSPWNTSGTPVKPASAHGWALIHMLHNSERKFGIAYCDDTNELLLEMAAVKSNTRKILIYKKDTQDVFVGVLDEDGNVMNGEKVSARYISVLHLIHLISTHQETETTWRECQKEFEAAGKSRIHSCTPVSYLLDALYFSINQEFPDVDLESGVKDIPFPCASDFRDITDDILGITGEFAYANIASPVKNKVTSKGGVETLETLKAKYSLVTKDFFDGLTENEKALIPVIEGTRLENYVITEDFLRDLVYIAHAIETKNLYCMSELMEGPPGIGKSLRAYAIAYIFNLPIRYIQGNKDVTSSDFVGGPTADNGVLRTFIDTPLIETMQRGGLLLMDDFTYIPEGYTTALLSTLENPFSIKAADGTVVKRHPMSFMYFTSNPDCYGSRPMNEAIRSRIFIIRQKSMEDLSRDELITIVMNGSGYTNKKDVEIMYQCYEVINNDVKTNPTMAGQAIELCIRNLTSWAMMAKIIGNPVLAAQDNVVSFLGASKEDARRVFTTIIIPRFPAKYSKK